MTAVNGGDKELYVTGQINNISCRIVVDIGANVSAIREDLARNSKVKSIWTPPCISLQIVTGDKIRVHGKVNITLRFGNINYWKYQQPYGIYNRYNRSLYSWTGFSEAQ
ncbi:retrovirus-related Pol polyprotein from transposon 412 [Trichonephila clavipes]|nr:retrovirus-related Pol polyprotein from transposon 412 [Trichonephila clavipes]